MKNSIKMLLLILTVCLVTVFAVACGGGSDTGSDTTAPDTTTGPIGIINTTGTGTTDATVTTTTEAPQVTTALITLAEPTDIALNYPEVSIVGVSDITSPSADNYTIVNKNADAVGKGDLILVNRNHLITFDYDTDNLYNLLDDAYLNGEMNYKLSGTLFTTENTYLALKAMTDALYAEKAFTHLQVKTAFRSAEKQAELAASSGAALPVNASDYQTALAVYLNVYPADKKNYELDSKDYSDIGAWLDANASSYGFINRYRDANSDYTGVSKGVDKYHYRYVGKVHAMFMQNFKLSLEEYLAYIRENYAFGEKHLKVEADGVAYEIYYVAANPNAATEVSVPRDGTYTVSGDNVSGFIVTVELPANNVDDEK